LLPFADYRTLSLQLGFTCNSRCSFCIVSDKLDPYANEWTKLSFVDKTLELAVQKGFHKVIVTGGEVTLYRRLPQVLRKAKALGLTVQVQTNGRRLAEPRYARLLAETGADEFFVSMHAGDAELHDRLTKVPGSWEQAWRGIANLQRLGVRVITNTVIVLENYPFLEAAARSITERGVRDAHFWFITPTGLADKDPMIPRVTDVAPYLKRAICAAEAGGAEVTVKYFPVCHLGEHASRLDNMQAFDMAASPVLHNFLKKGWHFHCPHEKTCPEFDRCGGLTRDYVRVHGDAEVTPTAARPGARGAAAPPRPQESRA
jgi:MoaA/NifB/PqqE/SkfB family radical SAM enzyme